MKIKLDSHAVGEIFHSAQTQAEYLEKLYRLAFPEWDEIDSISGWPKVDPITAEELFGMAMAADTRLGMAGKNVLIGGAWLNQGFGVESGHPLERWTIDRTECTVRLKSKAQA